ncbi:vacuolar import/degradation protein Vid24 [Lobosporangium transversale]|uniref:Vacuolar import/degradation protein Vid24 n=1 Tax=Lobosporangium transversale TaxID=64571 RepID=A0A1Y2GFK2_9FUNG|nr:vacuolar import/degradation protein Vid24 [Lobosporangium transversale]ORZ08534.1 vacuolar import/degradation protein Vid24 [Lobosporangium transversale]|eukprot:XP_021878462.1 vacuolar import/degradation protein Vid24 [Lobosporangium transversale]
MCDIQIQSISAVDYNAGVVYGLMEAMDVPMSTSSVVTSWEGEVIDFENYTLWTKKWAAGTKTDLDHWKRLEAFQGMDEKHIAKGAKSGKFRGHIDQKYILMRWKEKCFVNVSERTSGLTIAGFYYVSMRRADGYVEGYYHDKQSTPFQHLSLNPVYERGGFYSSIFEVA